MFITGSTPLFLDSTVLIIMPFPKGIFVEWFKCWNEWHLSQTVCPKDSHKKASYPMWSLQSDPATLRREMAPCFHPWSGLWALWTKEYGQSHVVPFLETALSHLAASNSCSLQAKLHLGSTPAYPETATVRISSHLERPLRVRQRGQEALSSPSQEWRSYLGSGSSRSRFSQWTRKELHSWTPLKFHKIVCKINVCFNLPSFGVACYIVHRIR